MSEGEKHFKVILTRERKYKVKERVRETVGKGKATGD